MEAKRRRDLIAQVWTERATYMDPALKGEGHAGIDAMVQGVHERFPGHRFIRTSDVDTHHNQVRFTWALAPQGGAPIVDGVDFGVIAEGGRLQAITGFFNQTSAKAQ
ncbi:MAG: nuclear transport factor 2 family protein [Hyphomonadaceae bacterium]|nr:nuclear transport factor 2 family protein [Hyphomonadaceae bacterium]